MNANVLKKLARNIRQKLSVQLIGESGGQLKIYSHTSKNIPLLLNQDSLDTDGHLTIIPVSETGRINIQLAGKKEERFIPIYAHQINRYQIVKRNNHLKLKGKRNHLSLVGNLFFTEDKPSMLAAIKYAYPVWDGLFVGASGLLSSKLNYELAYATFDNLPTQNIQDFNYFNGLGPLLGYQRYFPKLKGEVGGNINLFVYPDDGFGIDLFFVPDFLESFRINVGYNHLNLETNDIQFNPLGNAFATATNKTYKGFSLGIGYQFLF